MIRLSDIKKNCGGRAYRYKSDLHCWYMRTARESPWHYHSIEQIVGSSLRQGDPEQLFLISMLLRFDDKAILCCFHVSVICESSACYTMSADIAQPDDLADSSFPLWLTQKRDRGMKERKPLIQASLTNSVFVYQIKKTDRRKKWVILVVLVSIYCTHTYSHCNYARQDQRSFITIVTLYNKSEIWGKCYLHFSNSQKKEKRYWTIG